MKLRKQKFSLRMLVKTRKNLYHPDNLPLIQKFLGLRRGTKVLDVGCGHGFLSELCSAKTGPGTVTGVDTDEKLLAAARKRARHDGTGVRYQRGDAYRLPFADDTFDLVTEQIMLVHLRNPVHAIREMIRVTKPGGCVAAFECIYESGERSTYNPLNDESVFKILIAQDRRLYQEISQRVERYNLRRGLDRYLAIKLPSLFKQAGLEKVEVRAFANVHGWQENAAHDMKRSLEGQLRSLKQRGFRPSDNWQIREAVAAGVSTALLNRYTNVLIKINEYVLDNYPAFQRACKASLYAYTMLAVRGRKPK